MPVSHLLPRRRHGEQQLQLATECRQALRRQALVAPLCRAPWGHTEQRRLRCLSSARLSAPRDSRSSSSSVVADGTAFRSWRTATSRDTGACPRVGTCLVEGEARASTRNCCVLGATWAGARKFDPLPRCTRPSSHSSSTSQTCPVCHRRTASSSASTRRWSCVRRSCVALRRTELEHRRAQSLADARGRFGNVSCQSRGLCVAAEDLSWPSEADGGLAGIVLQRRSIQVGDS